MAEKRKDRVEVYRREDGLWEWRRIAPNGQIVATSGGQGYEREHEARQRALLYNPDTPPGGAE
jgi:uncharacterized protein YegP (UPF0339 family)